MALACLALAVAADPSPAAAATRCGTVTAKLPGGSRGPVAVRIVRGQVSCYRARRMIRRYLDTGRPGATSGWLCGAGYAGQRDIASCYASRGNRTVAGSRPR